MKRSIGVLLSFIMILVILPQITINAKAESGVDDFATRCYKVALQRDPDQVGFDFWKAKITNGELVGSTVVYEFIFSKEYEAQNREDKDFVNDLYTMFMGREADQDGYDYWCGQMSKGMTRKEVFAGFANSKEFYDLCYKYGITAGFYTNDYDIGRVNNINLFVERLYKTCLGRIGDKEGQAYWVEGMLKGELTGIACAANYIKSSEYEALELSNEQYVENLYIAFMGRQYDLGGKYNWLNYLNNKVKTRDQVFAGFANSQEFNQICASYGIECGFYVAADKARSYADIYQGTGHYDDWGHFVDDDGFNTYDKETFEQKDDYHIVTRNYGIDGDDTRIFLHDFSIIDEGWHTSYDGVHKREYIWTKMCACGKVEDAKILQYE